ncbi:hypothetical protein CsSME_00041798 [Camellia sinensis var. sinensis]
MVKWLKVAPLASLNIALEIFVLHEILLLSNAHFGYTESQACSCLHAHTLHMHRKLSDTFGVSCGIAYEAGVDWYGKYIYIFFTCLKLNI